MHEQGDGKEKQHVKHTAFLSVQQQFVQPILWGLMPHLASITFNFLYIVLMHLHPHYFLCSCSPPSRLRNCPRKVLSCVVCQTSGCSQYKRFPGNNTATCQGIETVWFTGTRENTDGGRQNEPPTCSERPEGTKEKNPRVRWCTCP